MKVKRLNTELYHYGIKGQRRGVRRFQNEDGSLTYAGKQRYLEPSRGTYTHDGTNIKREPNSFRPTLSYHSTSVNSTGYEARKNAERKKAELGQRTEDKKRASINASKEAARRRKLYDDNIEQYTAARKKGRYEAERPARERQERLRQQAIGREREKNAYVNSQIARSQEEAKRREKNAYVNSQIASSQEEKSRSSETVPTRNVELNQDAPMLAAEKRRIHYLTEAALSEAEVKAHEAEKKTLKYHAKLFSKAFKEVHSENINKGKSKVQSILAKLKR